MLAFKDYEVRKSNAGIRGYHQGKRQGVGGVEHHSPIEPDDSQKNV